MNPYQKPVDQPGLKEMLVKADAFPDKQYIFQSKYPGLKRWVRLGENLKIVYPMV